MTENRPRMSRGAIPEQGERERRTTEKPDHWKAKEQINNTDVDHVLSSKEIYTARYQPA